MALKLDWNEFVAKANMEFGTMENDWDPYARVAILPFNEEKERVVAKFNGKNVYPHTMYKDRIKNNDVWIVSLQNNGNYYFAKGIRQLDSSFLLELNKADIDAVANFIWEKNRDSIEPMLEEKYKESLHVQVAKTLEENRKADQEKIAELEEKLAELQKVNDEDKSTIKSLEDSMEALRSSTGSFAPQQGPQLPPSSSFVPWGQQDAAAPVTRISPDAIMSEAFTRSRYSVHLSSDHRFLLIVPDANGNVLCISKTITLAGLDTIAPFNGDTEMPCSYSTSFNGLLVTLK